MYRDQEEFEDPELNRFTVSIELIVDTKEKYDKFLNTIKQKMKMGEHSEFVKLYLKKWSLERDRP